MGEVEHPDVLRAMERIVSTARAAGLFVGAGMGPDPQFARRMIALGVQWLQVGGDFSYTIRSAGQIRSAIQNGSG
jgi:2-keto-3-deoxy-L-rhamnonate aldolase RhmA